MEETYDFEYVLMMMANVDIERSHVCEGCAADGTAECNLCPVRKIDAHVAEIVRICNGVQVSEGAQLL